MNGSGLWKLIGRVAAAVFALGAMAALACDEQCKTTRISSSGTTGHLGCPLQRTLSEPTLAVSNSNSDTTAPVLVDIDFDPKSVDVSQGAAQVTFTAHVTDDISGVNFVEIGITSPSGCKERASALLERSDGTPRDGTFIGTATIPVYAEPGNWTIGSVFIDDAAGNVAEYTTDSSPCPRNCFVFRPLSLPALEVKDSAPDTTPPELKDIDFTPKTVDVSNGPQKVTFTAHITDDKSGTQVAIVYLQSPSGCIFSVIADLTFQSGTPQDGTYAGTATVPFYAEAGEWTLVEVSIEDVAGNEVVYMTTAGCPNTCTVYRPLSAPNLQVNNSVKDSNPPVLVSLDFDPKSLDVSDGEKDVTFTAHITDDVSGVNNATVYLKTPGCNATYYAFLELVEGTELDGTWQGTATINQYATPGTWTVDRVDLSDKADNAVEYSVGGGPSPSASPSATASPTATANPTPATPSAVNISTRLSVGTGDNVLIGGFIVTGNAAKKVLIRAVGPSLPVSGALPDTVLELHNTSQLLATNDDWRTGGQEQEIQATGIPPSDDRESALIATLQPANYTAIVSGKGGTTGVALVEIYDLDSASASQLANISTRGTVLTGNNVMIGGFIISGGSAKVLVRAIGPSLASAGVSGALLDTLLELHNGSGSLIASDDNWKDDPSQQQQISDTGIPPSDARESAAVVTLPQGNYTAIVQGKGETTGVALVEVYALRQ